jgi:hypothetical protein
LTEYDLIGQAFCPHCDFKPTSQPQLLAPTDKLEELNETLEKLHNEWTQTLLKEIKVVADTEQWGLLQAKNRTLLDNFLNDNVLPETVSREFLNAVQEALSELIKVSFNLNELQNSIVAGGFPVTLAELQRRINHYLQEVIVDKEPQKIRIVLD